MYMVYLTTIMQAYKHKNIILVLDVIDEMMEEYKLHQYDVLSMAGINSAIIGKWRKLLGRNLKPTYKEVDCCKEFRQLIGGGCK